MQPIQVPLRITFGTELGTVSPEAVDTDSGIVHATFTAGAVPGWTKVLATTGQVTGTLYIEVGSGAPPVTDRAIYLPLIARD
jgi:hypothetical protein